jgi:hypothetical protein
VKSISDELGLGPDVTVKLAEAVHSGRGESFLLAMGDKGERVKALLKEDATRYDRLVGILPLSKPSA